MSSERLQMPASTLGEVEGYRAFAIPTVFGDYLPMVEFRLRTGHRFGFSYAWLTAANFQPEGIVLAFTNGTQVTIRGRHLLALYTALVRHQVVSVNEADEPTSLLVAESQPVVESIQVQNPE